MSNFNEELPVVNTHVHMPPNFSAYTTLNEVMEEATKQKVAALGISNFYDQQVYELFADLAKSHNITSIFGLEFITLDEKLSAKSVRVNDPANPGRIYFCGKGIAPFMKKSELASNIAQKIRAGNDYRAQQMVLKLAQYFAENGFDTGITALKICAQVATRGQVPVEWVSLQERHIAMAFQEAVFNLPVSQRYIIIQRLYKTSPAVDIEDPVAVQSEIRSRLMKVNTAGFVPEVPLSFEEAKQYVLEMKGIPCYPILADGAAEMSEFEWPPSQLAKNLLARGVYAAELIPNRNASEIVDQYVDAITEVGIIIMGGTEHNTQEKIPILPACKDGALSHKAREAFYKATCVVAAHQHLVANGEVGFVDENGEVPTDRKQRTQELYALGDTLIRNGQKTKE